MAAPAPYREKWREAPQSSGTDALIGGVAALGSIHHVSFEIGRQEALSCGAHQ
jgi:hypothetical protein